MVFDDYLKNKNIYKSIADKINTNEKLYKEFLKASGQISNNSVNDCLNGKASLIDMHYSDNMKSQICTDSKLVVNNISEKITPYQTAVIGDALKNGIEFKNMDKNFSSIYNSLWKQMMTFDATQSIVKQIIKTNRLFSDSIKSNVYSSNDNMECSAKLVSEKKQNEEKSYMNTSWIKNDSPWNTSISNAAKIVQIDYKEKNNNFIKLLAAESTTVQYLKKLNIKYTYTSNAIQIASMIDAYSQYDLLGLKDISGIFNGYYKFAFNQHKELHKAFETGHEDDVKWRLELLDVSAKFVDRQVIWKNNLGTILRKKIDDNTDKVLISQSSDNKIDYTTVINNKDVNSSLDESNNEISYLSKIPQEIGYTKRSGSNTSVIEGFERNRTVTNTEIGKYIVDKILFINQELEDRGEDNIFKFTNKTVQSMYKLGDIICNDENSFGTLIDNLYFLFYENIEHMKLIIGKGDKEIGDNLIRPKEVFQCIFRIKAIRSDLRHDLEHGTETEIKKKRNRTFEAYSYYTKKRPRKKSEYNDFQFKLFNEIANMLDTLCSYLSIDTEENE